MTRILTPDAWVIISISGGSEPTKRKLLCGWHGGYAGDDRWRLSSRIAKVEQLRGMLKVQTESGSVYACHDTNHKMIPIMRTMMAAFQVSSPDITFDVVS
jgi:hypothetical protein